MAKAFKPSTQSKRDFIFAESIMNREYDLMKLKQQFHKSHYNISLQWYNTNALVEIFGYSRHWDQLKILLKPFNYRLENFNFMFATQIHARKKSQCLNFIPSYQVKRMQQITRLRIGYFAKKDSDA